ncbi:hypothetical protein [Lysinibacillus capsici]|jgi:hypothetical protein|uniref:Putative lipoprotein n=1 Tax=Lysinibacillus capsici TaxID=2115968 RepID=A0A2X0XKB2_9BACI|nr:hypothetical protein [Lysinibacillus capsici]RDV31122.1 hypothetical protein C7B89_12440 [Lysinibacillus capsici]SPT99605.1 putative lipoprotein [Lysinibacillus capsici]
MQKKLVSILALLLTAVLVVGCNTSDKTGDSDAQQNEPSNTAADQKPSGDDTAGESNEEEEDTPASNDTNTEDASKQPQQDVKYVQKGVDKTEKATESASVDQSYKLQQLPGFTLTQEEPGKDMLVSNDDDEVFMRIETIEASQSSFEEVKTTMQDYMNAVGETVALTAEELAAFKDVQNIEGYVVDFDTEKVIGVVLEKDGLITKFTIHDNDEQDLTDAMLNMAATISKK